MGKKKQVIGKGGAGNAKIGTGNEKRKSWQQGKGKQAIGKQGGIGNVKVGIAVEKG